MPTLDTAIAYPGTCFFEGTNISEGRGTTRPFEQFGAPFIDGPQLADKLNELNVPGARFRPVFFQPSASKYSGELCQGAQLHVTERKVFDPVHTGVAALITVRNLYSSEFAWRVPSGGIHNFDRLAGGDKLRQTIDAGIEVEQLLISWQSDLDSFATVRQRYLLYR
jgi:beta-N-acetylhexosaminidase